MLYHVIGGDGTEYGPVSADQVRQWLAEGRLAAASQVRLEGQTAWQNLSAIPELSGPGQPPVAPPAPAPATVSRTAKTSGLAITSLVLGILSVVTCGVTALPGLIIGIVGLVKVNRSHGQLGGAALSITGICLSGLMLLFLPIWAAMVIPAVVQAREKARRAVCMGHLRQLGLALIMYANDNDERLPAPDRWADALTNNLVSGAETFRCPITRAGDRPYYYFFNRHTAGTDWQRDHETVLLVDGAQLWNATIAGPGEIMSWPHRQGCNVLFADGHVQFVRRERLASLHWIPETDSP